MYISYSGYKLYISCARAYWHRYINKTVSPPDNRVTMLYGETVGILFEQFYEDRLWRTDDVTETLLSRVDSVMDGIIKKESSRGGIWDWKKKNLKPGNRSQSEVREEVLATIPRGVAIIKHHRLLGVKAAAEAKLDADIGGHRLGGRADFILTRLRPHNDIVLIDGKGSRYRDKYVDRSQLTWYAMLYQHHRDRLPDQLAFLFWRCEPDEAVDWLECDQRSVDILKETVLDAITQVEAGKRQMLKDPGEATLDKVFPTQPSDGDCKFCSYLTVCPKGQSFLQKKAPIPESIGVEDIGLD